MHLRNIKKNITFGNYHHFGFDWPGNRRTNRKPHCSLYGPQSLHILRNLGAWPAHGLGPDAASLIQNYPKWLQQLVELLGLELELKIILKDYPYVIPDISILRCLMAIKNIKKRTTLRIRKRAYCIVLSTRKLSLSFPILNDSILKTIFTHKTLNNKIIKIVRFLCLLFEDKYKITG